jgi:hypothetical protein
MTIGRRQVSCTMAMVLVVLAATASAQQMPDPRQMSGIPRPDAALPAGTVTVRVIRGAFTNPVVSQTVDLAGAASPLQATTDDAGRAEFTGLKVGTRAKASATVAGERLESQEFVVPSTGGIRLMLVAAAPGETGDKATAAPPSNAPPQLGNVVLGEESRFVFEMGDDGLTVFYVLQIANAASAPVQPNTPLVFDLPYAARNAAVLEGSSPQATVSGRRLTIAGPFQPGSTLVQVAYTMPFKGSEIVVEQKLPARLTHVAVVAQKVGDLQLSSPQMPEQRTMPAQGNLYIAGRGGPVEAGDTLRFHFSGVPHQATWPRDVAFAIAALLLGAGAWSSFRARGSGATADLQRRELEARRDRLFSELTALEIRHREQPIDPGEYASRRNDLVAALEKVYIALDDDVALRHAS